MIEYACPKCREPLQASEDRLGTTNPCPNCKFPVQVPLVRPKSSFTAPIIVAIIGGLAVLACPMFIVVCLAAIQILGKNANSSFGTVGASIGSFTTSKQIIDRPDR
jgi:hypothetical protein